MADTESKRTGENNERLRSRTSGISGREGTTRIQEDVANSNTGNVEAGCERQRRIREENTKESNQIMLPAAVKLWPTPTNQSAGKGKFLETLTTKEGEPAKQGERAYNPKTGKHVQITLDRAVKLWPTPTVNDSKNNAGPSQFKRKGTNLNVAVAKAGETSGTLNPTWVEWLMGYPAEYTDLKDWETLSSRKSRKKSVKP
jgi:hypothetical protein